MSAATPHNESLADAVALIAVCKRSVALMEVAFALQVVASGVTAVPEEARRNWLFARVHRRMTNPALVAAARAALGNEGLGRVAACFRAACFEYATPRTGAPFEDEEWLRAIQVHYLLEENMRVLGDMVLELMGLPEVDVEARRVAAEARTVAMPVSAQVEPQGPPPEPTRYLPKEAPSEPPPRSSSTVESSKAAAEASRVNIRPPALRVVPARATHEPARRPLLTRGPRRVQERSFYRAPEVEPSTCRPPQPRGRSPPLAPRFGAR